MELDKPANLHTEPSGGQPRTLTSGAPIPDGAASPAQTQMPSPGRNATHRKLDGSEDVDHCDSRFPESQSWIEQQPKNFERLLSTIVKGEEAREQLDRRRQVSSGNLIGEPPRVGAGLSHEAAIELNGECQERCRQGTLLPLTFLSPSTNTVHYTCTNQV